jgi:hypothetical protein
MATKKVALTEAAAAELKIPLASAAQLAEYAETVLGLDGVNYRLGSDALIAKIRITGHDKDFIEVSVPEADIQRIDPPRPVSGRRMATIRIYNQETPGGTEPVPVAVNGKQMFIPRDRDCDIPWEYYHALDNARKYVYDTDSIGRLDQATRKEVHEYPFSLIREDPPLPSEKKAA